MMPRLNLGFFRSYRGIWVARADNPSADDMEFPQGEPISAYYPYIPTGGFLIPEALFNLPPSARSGTMSIAFDPDDYWALDTFDEINRELLGRGAVVEAKEASGKSLISDWDIARSFTGVSHPARWIRLDQPPLVRSFPDLMNTLVSA